MQEKKNIIPITVMEVSMVMAMARIMKMRRKGCKEQYEEKKDEPEGSECSAVDCMYRIIPDIRFAFIFQS